ncbi:lysoplasmalogenase [Microbulbifer yueqingensis]|uniref:Uncharacterized membrane protein YhhN n=1 Tax=Microbulbifer yueqingensis TaxID=658219 RepID=A0A1G9DD52_9GAMM|nr:lysoplasmalogenase [Microbulbifer yueqingensis]SDK61822.1 Uncharacterized membrane protein YhhN [Microbulbifer yueqingensis]
MTTTATTAAAGSGAAQTTRGDMGTLGAFLLFAVAYIIFDAMGFRTPWLALVKAAPIALLLWLALRRLAGTGRILTATALAFCALGDVLLALDFPNQFVAGLAAFLVAQLTYTANFLRRADFRSVRFLRRGLPVLGAALLLAQVLLPAAGDLTLPVTAYLLASVAMAMAAAAHRGEATLLYCGALAFLLSDTLIGLNRFLVTVPLAGTLVMTFYYGAQLAMLQGVRRAGA